AETRRLTPATISLHTPDLTLSLFWHRSRNTHPMLVWARGLFRQVVGEFVGMPAARQLRMVAEQDVETP
ncbi:LysR family transcriptional regulator, partial [Cupriavidus pinatubonensis]